LPIARAFVFDVEAPVLRFRSEAIDAMAAYAVIQWIQLDYALPDLVIPMPDPVSQKMGALFASLLQAPCAKILADCDICYALQEEIEGDNVVIFDGGNPLEELKKGIAELAEAFPKRMFLLSLYHDLAPSHT
jgi:hypothetical protein